MAMDWSNSRMSFQGHNEYMRRFHEAHAGATIANARRRQEPCRLQDMQPLMMNHKITDTGGSMFPKSDTNWFVMVPAIKVARYKLSQN